MDENALGERWIFITEAGVILQIASLLFVYQAGTFNGELTQQLAVVGGVVVFVPLVLVISIMAVWQDIQLVEQQLSVETNGLLWIAIVVFIPILGTSAYLWEYSRFPVYRGLTGRIVAYWVDEEIETSDLGVESSQGSTSPHKVGRSPTDSVSDKPNSTDNVSQVQCGSGQKNQLPELKTQDQIVSNNNTEVTRVVLSENNITAVQKSLPKDSTITLRMSESLFSEATTWKKIDNHDHIVSVYGWGGKPFPWMLLEDMSGGNFRDVIENEDTYTTVRLLSQVCEAVYHGHERGVYHFDLKPSNILLESSGQVAKVADWGSAEVFMEDNDSVQELTPAYTSPELVDGSSMDPSPQTDIFQIGILAYESLTGTHPFKKESTNETIDAIKNTNPQPPSEINHSLSDEIDQSILKALNKNPNDRHKTLLQFSEELVTTVTPYVEPH